MKVLDSDNTSSVYVKYSLQIIGPFHLADVLKYDNVQCLNKRLNDCFT